MTKNHNRNKQERSIISAKGLFYSAAIIEVVNIILTSFLGFSQADVCPKSSLPGNLSLFFSVLAALLVLAVSFLKSSKTKQNIIVIFSLGLIVIIGLILQFVVVGGLDWCGYQF